MGCDGEASERFSVSFWSEGRGKPHNRLSCYRDRSAVGKTCVWPPSAMQGECYVLQGSSSARKRFRALYGRSAVFLMKGAG